MSLYGKVKVEMFDTTFQWLQEVSKETGKDQILLLDEMVKDYIIFTLGNEKAKKILKRVEGEKKA